MKKNIIIIPTYNERENIGNIVKAIFQTVPDISILVVDDNSPDLTHEAVRELQKDFFNLDLLVREKKNGLGEAYIEAFKTILNSGEIEKVVMMDADFSHDPKYLPPLLDGLADSDVVIGSRYTAGGGTEGWERWRKILSRYGNKYARLIMGLPVYDCTAGFIAFRTDLLKKIDLSKIEMSGYAFLMEFKYLLWLAQARFKEVPIIFKNRLSGESKISSHIISEGVLAPWRVRIRNIWKK